jgi:TetR/AcrR family transcriptional regulator, regulator of autoinduction and epiphytic fitness
VPAVRETSVTAPASADAADPQPDGRLTRAARTRASVVEALLTLNEKGHLRPTARDIAAEAGVSLRSLYVHFDDLEALFVAASQRHGERLAAVLPPLVTEGTFEERFEAFVERRRVMYEFGAGVRRAALLQEPFSPAIRQAMSVGRQRMRLEVSRAFAPEIAASRDGEAGRLPPALEIATGPATWESLRTHQGLSADEALAQVRDMALAFIHAWVPGPRGSGTWAPDTTQTTVAGPRG